MIPRDLSSNKRNYITSSITKLKIWDKQKLVPKITNLKPSISDKDMRDILFYLHFLTTAKITVSKSYVFSAKPLVKSSDNMFKLRSR